MKDRKIKRILTLAAALMLTGCGSVADSGSPEKSNKTDVSSVEDSAGQTESTAQEENTPSYDVPETLTAAAEGYDPDGETRMFDALKEEFYGDYHIETISNTNGMTVTMTSDVKGNTMALSTVNQGMMSRAYYFEDKTFYSISDGTTSYEKYTDYEYDIRNSDTLFGATADFQSAEINENGEIKEVYGIDSEFTGISGTMTYIFDKESGALTKYTITFDGFEMKYSVKELSRTDPSAFELPDLSTYQENPTYQTPIVDNGATEDADSENTEQEAVEE